jgi:hypothetical protein
MVAIVVPISNINSKKRGGVHAKRIWWGVCVTIDIIESNKNYGF